MLNHLFDHLTVLLVGINIQMAYLQCSVFALSHDTLALRGLQISRKKEF